MGAQKHGEPWTLKSGGAQAWEPYISLRLWEALLQPHIGNVEMMWSVFKEKLLEGISVYIPSMLPFSSWKKKNGRDHLQIRRHAD